MRTLLAAALLLTGCAMAVFFGLAIHEGIVDPRPYWPPHSEEKW